MASVTRTTTWSDNQVLTASALNGEFNNLLNALNIVNADISGSASIATSKIAATFPASGILVGTTDSQTVSGKTLTKPVINGSTQGTTADSDGSTITFDMTNNVHTVTLGGNRTLAVTNASVNQWFYIRLTQGSGGQTVTWFSTIKWPNATAPTLSTTAARVDSFAFFCVSSGNYDGYIVGQNLG